MTIIEPAPRPLVDVVAIMQLPPPVNGLSLVNEEMGKRLADAGRLAALWDIAPPVGKSGVFGALARGWRVLVAAFRLVFRRPRGVRILYMPCDGGTGLLFNIVLALTARCLGLELWMHHHSFAYVDRRSVLFAVLMVAAPRGALHIGLCKDMISRLSVQYARQWSRAQARQHVLPNAFVFRTAKTSRQNRPAGPIQLGHMSNLTVDKGTVSFLDLVLAAHVRGLDVEGRLAGPIVDPEIETALAERAALLPGRLTWVGPVYGQAKSAFLNSLDAFVFPTRYANEAQPLVLLEALAAGAPILSIERGCIGCDHRESPGLTAPANEFQQAALDWIARNLVNRSGRAAARHMAYDRSELLSREAEASLSALLAMR
ncbi:glycosyltransferase [Brevundimonas sp.]|uniref:glycosyltransferase n=1 Tax=Brevundimonas sp. TaxID=1871086 RepID=UPI002602F9F6|nr:glycosyltransferase [Brevundimonas sp.]